ncbi:MAG: ATP-binding protein, partial [Chromatiaceae bacterium]
MDTNPASGGDECVDAAADALGFYDNPVYANAWSVVLSGISECSGPVVVTGEPGIGKSRLMKRVVKCVGAGVHPVFASHPERAIGDLLDGIEAAFGPSGTEVERTDTPEGQLSRCRERLLDTRQDRLWIALFVDDADALPDAELSRLLGLALPDQEHSAGVGCEPLLTLILAGLPKLEHRLAEPEFRALVGDHLQLCRLQPLRPSEVGAYVQKRCEVVGSWRHWRLSAEAAARIGTCTRGIPRLIDNLCDAVALTAKRQDQEHITAALVDEAAQVCAVSLALGTVDRADALAAPDTRPWVTDRSEKGAPAPGAADETLDGGLTDSEGESPSQRMAGAALASSASSSSAITSTQPT